MTKQIVAYSFSSASPELLWCHSAGRIEGGPDYAYAHRKGLPRTTLFLTCEGAGTFRVGRRTWVAREPSVTLLLPTASPAEWRTEDQKWTFWWIDCLGAGWKEYLSQFGTAPRARTHEIGIEGANRLQEQFRRLIASHRTPNARSRFLFQTIGMELILGLLEATTFQLGARPGPLIYGNEVFDAVDGYLARPDPRPDRVDEVAALIHASPGHISRVVRFSLGMSLKEYMICQRISQAKRLLAETRESVEAVGRKVGYPDIYYFSSFFKRRVGMAPTSFRRKYWD